MKRTCKIIAALAVSLAALAEGAAQAQTALFESPEYLRITWGVVLESFLDPALQTPGSLSRVPATAINFNFGGGVSIPFSAVPGLAFAPSGDIYYYNAEYTENGQPVATALEDSSAFVLGLLLNVPVVYTYSITDAISVSGGLGLAFDIRAAITQTGDTAKAANTALMNSYFWDKGRFFMPSTSLRFEYKLTERVGFGFNGRVFWPIYNWWTGENFGFFDQAKYFIDLVIRYKFDAPATGPAPAPAELPPPATITAPTTPASS